METWLLENSETVQVIVFFGLIVLLPGVERIVRFRSRHDAMKGRWRANWGLTAVNVALLSTLPLSFVSAAVWAQQNGVGLFNQMKLGVLTTLTATLLVRAFISFFTHCLMHKVPALWSLHRIHHLDTEMDVSTTVRVHPLELLINLVPGVAIVVVSGLSPWALVLYELLDVIVTLFSHARITLPGPIDRVLHRFIVTPNLHRIHHSSWQPETDSNFGAVFPVWDMVFGTFRGTSRDPQESMELGLEEIRDRRTTSFLWLLLAPFRSDESLSQEPEIDQRRTA